MTPETAEKTAIKQYFQLIGVFYYSNLAGIASYPGLADITAIHNGVVYQIEVKAGKNKQSVNQQKFERTWRANGGNYICGGLAEVMTRIKK